MKKVFTLLTLLLTAVVSANAVDWPDESYLLLDGKSAKSIANGNSNSYTNQVGGSGATWSINTAKYSYNATSCTFYGNAFTKGLKSEGATYTQVVTTGVSTLTIVQSLATNPGGSLDIETVGSDPSDRADINSFDADNLIVNTYSGTHTVGGKTYKDVKVFKLCNLPAGTYKIYRASANSAQTYVVYMGVTYGATDKVTITTAQSNEGSSTVAGGGDYLVGATATLTATPGAGKAFDHWELGGSNVSTDNPYSFTVSAAATYTAVYTDAATKTISAVSGNDTYGSAETSATVVAEGGSTTLTATPSSEAYVFDNWTKSSDGSWSSTTNPLVVGYDDLADGETYTANFRKLYTVSYDLGTYGGTATKVLNNYSSEYSVNEKYASAANKYTIPSYAHRYLYREGYVLSGWTDGSNTYATGDEITLTGDITLTPTWTATTQTLANSSAETTVTWTLDKTQLLFNAWQGTGQVGYYTKPCTINGELIAVPMTVDATSNKIDNIARSGSTQINAGVKFTIPAVKGMTITINCSESEVMTSENTLVGTDGVTVDGKVATYTYTGDASSVTINMNAGRYYEKIAVTYPAQTVAATITSAEWATFVPTAKVSVPTGVKAYIATAATTSAITLSDEDAITVIDANTPVIINGAKGTYYFPITTADASDVTGNKLQAGPLTDSDGTNYYVLGKEDAKVGFGLLASGTELPATKAYIPASAFGATAPAFVPFFFGEMETTGISGVAVNGTDTFKEGVFNLNGQRVAQPTKGLYIVGGKKVMVK